MLTKYLFILKTRIDCLCLQGMGNTAASDFGLKQQQCPHSNYSLVLELFGEVVYSVQCVSVSYFCASPTTFHDLLLRKYITHLLPLFLQISLLTRGSGMGREELSLVFSDVYHKNIFPPLKQIPNFVSFLYYSGI